MLEQQISIARCNQAIESLIKKMKFAAQLCAPGIDATNNTLSVISLVNTIAAGFPARYPDIMHKTIYISTAVGVISGAAVYLEVNSSFYLIIPRRLFLALMNSITLENLTFLMTALLITDIDRAAEQLAVKEPVFISDQAFYLMLCMTAGVSLLYIPRVLQNFNQFIYRRSRNLQQTIKYGLYPGLDLLYGGSITHSLVKNSFDLAGNNNKQWEIVLRGVATAVGGLVTAVSRGMLNPKQQQYIEGAYKLLIFTSLIMQTEQMFDEGVPDFLAYTLLATFILPSLIEIIKYTAARLGCSASRFFNYCFSVDEHTEGTEVLLADAVPVENQLTTAESAADAAEEEITLEVINVDSETQHEALSCYGLFGACYKKLGKLFEATTDKNPSENVSINLTI